MFVDGLWSKLGVAGRVAVALALAMTIAFGASLIVGGRRGWMPAGAAMVVLPLVLLILVNPFAPCGPPPPRVEPPLLPLGDDSDSDDDDEADYDAEEDAEDDYEDADAEDDYAEDDDAEDDYEDADAEDSDAEDDDAEDSDAEDSDAEDSDAEDYEEETDAEEDDYEADDDDTPGMEPLKEHCVRGGTASGFIRARRLSVDAAQRSRMVTVCDAARNYVNTAKKLGAKCRGQSKPNCGGNEQPHCSPSGENRYHWECV